ncbi:MAG: hypothetical protein AAF532_13265 [Planctomycetota bacterium]
MLRTDLSAEDAEELLDRLEAMLKIVSAYWRKPNRAPLAIAVVDDADRWPSQALPPEVFESVSRGGGITRSVVRSTRRGVPLDATATAYASTRGGTPLHEAVHAYCYINFGRVGPIWYAEGMAEMGAYWAEGDAAVHAPEYVCRYLRNTPIASFNEIVNGEQQTGDSGEKYAWRWALCHLLATNPNYAPRFRPLGLNLLTGRPDSFEQAYGTMRREIEFEYRQFVKHVAPGYRADLTAWDWKERARPVAAGRSRRVRVRADAGWQPAGIEVAVGERWAFDCEGTWDIGPDRTTDAAGEAETTAGRLTAAVFDPRTYTLGEPFEIGSLKEFETPAGGHLVLRCGDDWRDLGDNSGRISVDLTRVR